MSIAGVLPNPITNPGFVNPNVTPANIQKTICQSGWTATIRPSSSYTDKVKLIQIQNYEYKDRIPGNYEEDHIISLELGGHPTDLRNLWPQPYNSVCGARIKDKVETRLKNLVCSGKVGLREAQLAISKDWVKAYRDYVDPNLVCPK
jgi:hypothetical protein